MEFAGKTVLVTGGATCLGFATAAAFLEAGAQVMINGSTEARLEAARPRLAKYGDRVAIHRADVRESEQVAGLVRATVDRFGGIDILVNNAGTNGSFPVVEMPEAEWDRVVDINLKGTFLMSQAVGRVMLAQGRGGRIVNISSTAGRSARAGAAHYCASKAGVILLTQVLALELGRDGITVNAICPGLIPAPDKVRLPTQEYIESFVSAIPLGHPGEPEDIASTVLFLASEGAKYITGEVITVDGGTLAGRYFLPRDKKV